MAYYTTGTVGVPDQPLEVLPSSAGAALSAAAKEAWVGNPTNVLADYLQFVGQNNFQPQELEGPGSQMPVPVPQEDRLSQIEAQDLFKTEGVKLTAPESGLSKAAAQTLIERKREEMVRQDTLSRAPGGVVQGGLRLGAGLAVSILDPLNVASAFVPVVGPARYAAMLERAGASNFARAAVRARVGAIEGVAGAAMLEPGVYLGRTQLQDDYGLTDSLLNLAFGTVLGGGLHVVGGRVSDHFKGVGKKIDVGAESGDDVMITPEDMPSPVRSSDFATPEPRAPFARLTDITPERAQVLALDELQPQLRTQLLSEIGNRAGAGDIAALKTQADDLRASLEAADTQFKTQAKEFQKAGASRKQAESQARKLINDQKTETQSRLDAVEQQIEVNRQASVAEQDLAKLDGGEVPPRFADQVNQRAREFEYQAAIQRAMPASQVAAMATPQARQDALRVAVAQAVSGKNIDIEPVLRSDPVGVMDSARRQASPESSRLVDFPASAAAADRVSAAPNADVAGAQQKLSDAMASFDAVRQNLEQGGFSPEQLARITDELKAFDDIQAQAKSLGDATRAAAVCGLRG